MVDEVNRTDDWSDFMRRMRHEFEGLVGSKPADVQDVVQELRKHDDSITFLDALRDSVAEVNAASRLLCLDSRPMARLFEEQKAA
jgi:hypothetical protein